MQKDMDQLAINTLRFLSVDQIQKANSGHPGLPMGIAPAAYTLWSKVMKHNPQNSNWINRDRFVLSAGHGSSLLYSMIYLFGYDLTIDDLKNFRQLNSKTKGHPEHGVCKGIEVTTGPLGQGIANAVGMAMAEKFLGASFNTPDYSIIDHYTYVVCGDGCLMEGIASEALSLAGSLCLNKLVVIYDSNNITIEGDTKNVFNENVCKRVEAYGFNTIVIKDGNNTKDILKALENAKKSDKPTLIEVKTKIGFGSPNKQGKASAHGEPLGVEEIKLAKANLDFNYTEDFYVPVEVKEHIGMINATLKNYEDEWNKLLIEYKKANPKRSLEFDMFFDKKLPVDLLKNEIFWTNEGNLATRVSSEVVLNKVKDLVPNLIGGAADLAPSTKSYMKSEGDFYKDNYWGRNLHFGVREHAMSAIANGIALHGGLRIYTAGFFIFSDYAKAALRLSALMELPVINIFTHDSIGVGEDGPTHQPVEQLVALRSIPNFTVIRPCDSNETSAAWYLALTRQTSPTAIILTRQNLRLLKETGVNAIKGAYILRDSENPDIILIASGSEVSLVYDAFDELVAKGLKPRVVSMPSMEIFEEQSDEYKESILPKNIRKRLAVEAGATMPWYKYVGLDGKVIGIDTFGDSAPANLLFEKYGFTLSNVVNTALSL